jgi:hypothetical protein
VSFHHGLLDVSGGHILPQSVFNFTLQLPTLLSNLFTWSKISSMVFATDSIKYRHLPVIFMVGKKG